MSGVAIRGGVEGEKVKLFILQFSVLSKLLSLSYGYIIFITLKR